MPGWGFEWGELWGSSTTWPNTDEDGSPLPIEVGDLWTIDTALARLYKQFEGRPNWERLCEIYGLMWHEVESILAQIDRYRYVATATGKQLDEVGAAVGRARGSLTDDALYRLAIIVDTATLFSQGTRHEIREMAKRLLGSTARYRDYYPKAFRLLSFDVSGDVYHLLRDVMQDVPPAGTAALLSLWITEDMGGFTSTHGGAVDEPGAFGSIYGSTSEPSLFMSGRTLGT